MNFIGGSTDESVLEMSKEDLVQQVDSDLRRIVLKPDAPAPQVLGVRVWKQAIPQYNK